MMKIFSKNDLTFPPPQLKANRAVSPSLQLFPGIDTRALVTFFLFVVVGGGVGFAIRGIVYMAGFQDWIFTAFPNNVELGDVLKSVDGKWGRFLLIMCAFLSTIIALFTAVTKFMED